MTTYPDRTLFTRNIDRLLVGRNATLIQVLTAMETAKQAGLPPGMVVVVDEQRRLAGVVTDGDVRRSLLEGRFDGMKAVDVMNPSPASIPAELPVTEAVAHLRQSLDAQHRRMVRHALLVDGDRRVVGLIDVAELMLIQAWNWDSIAVIGMGYVGLTLAVTLAEIGFRVVGWDANADLRANLAAGNSHVFEPGLESLLRAQLASGQLTIATSPEGLEKCRAYVLAVGTPLRDGTPYLGSLQQAIAAIGPGLRHGDLVILRSTVPVGTCRGVVAEELAKVSGLKPGTDIGIAFAPERTVEGKALQELRTLPQVIAGIDEWSAEAAARIFGRLTSSLVRLERLEEAEFVKLINNGFRDVSFAFANEIALMCETYNLDAHRVIDAANLGYPRNAVALPSPGVGGSCLVKDPYILSITPSDRPGESLSVVGRRINEHMPGHVTRKVLAALRDQGVDPATATVFVIGFAFKGEPETSDLRDSVTLDVLSALKPKVAKIRGFDPIVKRADIEALGVEWTSIADGFAGADAVIVMNNHRSLQALDVRKHGGTMHRPGIFFDGWRMFNREDVETIPGVTYMSLGYATPASAVASQEECVSV